MKIESVNKCKYMSSLQKLFFMTIGNFKYKKKITTFIKPTLCTKNESLQRKKSIHMIKESILLNSYFNRLRSISFKMNNWFVKRLKNFLFKYYYNKFGFFLRTLMKTSHIFFSSLSVYKDLLIQYIDDSNM